MGHCRAGTSNGKKSVPHTGQGDISFSTCRKRLQTGKWEWVLGNLAGQAVGKLILAREYYEQKTSLGWGQFSGAVQLGYLWDYK